jgi:hypothetical protein
MNINPLAMQMTKRRKQKGPAGIHVRDTSEAIVVASILTTNDIHQHSLVIHTEPVSKGPEAYTARYGGATCTFPLGQ